MDEREFGEIMDAVVKSFNERQPTPQESVVSTVASYSGGMPLCERFSIESVMNKLSEPVFAQCEKLVGDAIQHRCERGRCVLLVGEGDLAFEVGQALVRGIKRLGLTWCYLTCESFVNQWCCVTSECDRQNSELVFEEFVKAFSSYDVLLIDDVDFMVRYALVGFKPVFSEIVRRALAKRSTLILTCRRGKVPADWGEVVLPIDEEIVLD